MRRKTDTIDLIQGRNTHAFPPSSPLALLLTVDAFVEPGNTSPQNRSGHSRNCTAGVGLAFTLGQVPKNSSGTTEEFPAPPAAKADEPGKKSLIGAEVQGKASRTSDVRRAVGHFERQHCTTLAQVNPLTVERLSRETCDS